MSSSCTGCITDQFKKVGFEPETKCCLTEGLGAICALAIVIISGLAIAGVLPSAVAGWSMVGIAAAGFALNLAAGKLDQRKITLILAAIATAAIMTVAALGAMHILSANNMAWGIVSLSLLSALAQVVCKQLQAPKQKP